MGNTVKCPVCGEEVDLSNEEEAITHMNIDDEAHRRHREEAQAHAVLTSMCGTGIMRRVN